MAPKNAKTTETAADANQSADPNAAQPGGASSTDGDGGNGDQAASETAAAPAAAVVAEDVNAGGGSQDGGSSLPPTVAQPAENGVADLGTGSARTDAGSANSTTSEPAVETNSVAVTIAGAGDADLAKAMREIATTTEIFPAVAKQRLPPPFLDKNGNAREFASDVKLEDVRMLKNVKIDGVFLEFEGTYAVPYDIWSALDDLDAIED